MSSIWTEAFVGLAVRTLSVSATVADACRKLNVEPKNLKKAFERRGLGAPSTYTRNVADELTSEAQALGMYDYPQRVLVVPDAHHPFADATAWNLLLKIGRHLKPHVIVVLGDFADFYSVSFHGRDPNRVSQLADEVGAVNNALDELDELGASRKVFLAGNHEFRLERYLQDKAPALFNTVNVQELLKLEKRGWEYVPYKQHAKVGKAFFCHDVGSGGKTAASKAGATFEHSVVIGHCHAMQVSYFGNALDEHHVAASLGWLGDVNATDYMYAMKSRRDWQHGCGVAYMENDGTFHLQAVPFINGKAVVSGQLIS